MPLLTYPTRAVASYVPSPTCTPSVEGVRRAPPTKLKLAFDDPILQTPICMVKDTRST